jgi:small-conductance mechanosensitive channel
LRAPLDSEESGQSAFGTASITDGCVASASALPEAAAPAESSAPVASSSSSPVQPSPPPSAVASAPALGSAAASAAASVGAPIPSASAGEPPDTTPESIAKIHDAVVFVLRHPHGAKSAADRARAASEALSRAVETDGTEDVKLVRQGDATVVFAGSVPVVELYAEDVEGSGFSTTETHAAAVAAHVRAAVTEEKRRSEIAAAVFSFSLLVFLGLVAFYVIQKIGEFFQSARQWMLDNPDRITGIRVQSQEVIGPTALRGGALVAVIVGRFVAQGGVFYLWLVFALSLFQTTRPYTEKLTGFVVTPLSDLAGRFAASLPLAVMAIVSGVTVYVLLRIAQLFFDGVARRQTVLPWLPADLAAPTSVLVRLGIVLAALVLVAPLITGDANGALTRAGSVVLLAIGFSMTPLLSSVVVGTLVVYGRKLRVGEYAEIGNRSGKVLSIGLVDVRLKDRDGCEVRVPHLLALIHPTRVLGLRPRVAVEIAVAASAPPREVRRILLEAAGTLGDAPTVDLAALTVEEQRFRITLSVTQDKSPGDVRLSLAEALAAAGVAFARVERAESSPP